MDEEAYKSDSGGGVAGSGSDADVDQLLRERNEIDSALRRHKAQMAVLFTDIVGSTAFFERFGDTAGLVMLQRHHELVLPTIEEASGTVVKTIGDAVLATFSSPQAAVRTAINIQLRLNAFNENRPQEERIFTRIGINFGTGIVKDRDLFGDVVNVAARFVKACAPAQILVSSTVYVDLTEQSDIVVRKLGTTTFHGKAEPEEIYEVLWTTEEHYDRLRHQLDRQEKGHTTRSALGRYELLEELGRGAMGLVHKAYDPAVARIVALKTVRLDVTGPEREELVRRLRQEAQAAGRLEHTNIVTIYDAGEAEGVFYLTMQYVKGRTLGDLTAGRNLLPVKQIVLLVDQVCEGLHYAHERGIVHRDLKPNNIIITPEGTAKIVDFGIAKITEAGTTMAGLVVGTPSYMSPEQAQGGRIDRRSDIFSLGAMLYELLTGEKPFPGNTPTTVIYKIVHEEPIPLRAIEPTIDPSLERIVRKCLAKSPFERYQTCRELQEALKTVGKAEPRAEPKAEAPVEVAAPAKKTAAPRDLKPKPAKPVRKAVVPEPPVRRRGWEVTSLALLAVVLGLLAWQQNWIPFLRPPAAPRRQAAPMVSPGPKKPVEQPVSSKPLASPEAKPRKHPPAPVAASASTEPKKKETPPEPEAQAESKPEPKAETPPPQSAPAKTHETAPPARPGLSPEQQSQIDRWFRQADQYIGRGEYNNAIYVLKQILERDPNNKQAQEKLEKVRKRQELQAEQPPSP